MPTIITLVTKVIIYCIVGVFCASCKEQGVIIAANWQEETSQHGLIDRRVIVCIGVTWNFFAGF